MDLEKEAARIVEEIKQYFDTYRIPDVRVSAYKLSSQKCIEHALRAAHNAAMEKAVRIVHRECDPEECKSGCVLVRALKIGAGKCE